MTTKSRIVFLADSKIYHISTAIPDGDVWGAIDQYDVEHGTRIYDHINPDGILAVEGEADDHLYMSEPWMGCSI